MGMAIERWWLEPWETSKATMGLLTLVACISPPGIKYTFCCDPLPLSKVSRFDGISSIVMEEPWVLSKPRT
jgi:hypothetical protein